MIERRIQWASAIALGLSAVVVTILLFADTYSFTDESRHCASHYTRLSQSLAWLGCTLAAHEGLAGGLIGGAGALFAAWLAFTAVQEQLAEERHRLRQRQADAKEAALVCITQPIHAAAMALSQINKARQLRGSVAPKTQAAADQLVNLSVAHVRSTIESFTIRESVHDLGVEDRVMYLLIVSTLSTFVNVSTNPSPVLTRDERLRNQREALMRLHNYLTPFDSQLAQVYARDSGTTPADAPASSS
jgi:hypothetical protein